ncbi:MAG: hypothetical protein HKP50_08145, partial [Myxococcales bacterium]|nr:hypothetical protein [Myxococcales bacterium]
MAAVWCLENVCDGFLDVEVGYCNNDPDNPYADGQFVCECVSGECSRLSGCVPTSDCVHGEATEAFCEADCVTACGSADNIRR